MEPMGLYHGAELLYHGAERPKTAVSATIPGILGILPLKKIAPLHPTLYIKTSDLLQANIRQKQDMGLGPNTLGAPMHGTKKMGPRAPTPTPRAPTNTLRAQKNNPKGATNNPKGAQNNPTWA